MSTTSSSAPMIAPVTSAAKLPGWNALLWTPLLVALTASTLLTLYLFRETIISLVTIWDNSHTYSYGYVIVPLVALLVRQRKEILKQLTPTVSPAGICCAVLSVLVWLGGNIGDAQLLQHIALIALLDSLVWAFLGTVVARNLAFPMLFLFFAVPMGDSLVPLLQRWTAAFTVAALHISGIPAVQDGYVLSTPSGDWQVAEACSGIRYLLASVVIGTLVAGVAYRSWKRRIAFLALSVLLPIVANALRAYGIVVLAYISGNSIATGVDHVIYGFVFFSLLTSVLVFAAMKSYEPGPSPRATESVSHPDPAPQSMKAAAVSAFTFMMVVLISATVFAGHLWARTPEFALPKLLTAPAGWFPTAAQRDQEWAPDPRSAQSRTLQSYSDGTQQISLCIIQYPDTRRGVELITGLNVVGRSGAWLVIGSGTRPVSVFGEAVTIAQYTIENGSQHRLVWVWYAVGKSRTSNPYELRLLQARERLTGNLQPTVLYALSTPMQSNETEAANALGRFLK